MAIVFMLITAETASEKRVYNQLQKIQEVLEIHPLFGEQYDMLAKVETEDDGKSREVTITRIKSLEGIRDTKVLTGCS